MQRLQMYKPHLSSYRQRDAESFLIILVLGAKSDSAVP